MLKERRPVGRLFFNMGLPIAVRWRLYIASNGAQATRASVSDNNGGIGDGLV